LLGKVKASGLTVDELRQQLFKKVEPLLQDPYVLVSLPKRGVTVIGEVKGSSSFVFPKEKTNIFEVLAQAGYSTQFSDLSRVKVYRESENGQRILGHMNLNDTTFFNSPFFYPLPNDVVYVPASKDRSVQKFTQTVAPIIALGVSVVTLIVTLTLRR